MRRHIPGFASLFLCMALVRAADEPVLKEGLWSIHTETTSQPGGKKTVGNRSLCRSHAYDQEVRARAKAQAPDCKTIVDKSDGAKWENETECVIAGTTTHSKSTVTRAGENAVHSETHATYNPPLGGVAEMSMAMDQKYVGACPAGVDPGDSIGADGKVMKARKR